MISDNIARIRRCIHTACVTARRNVNDITLIAISKQKSASELIAAYDAGIRHFGENYLQEALPKIHAVNTYASQGKICWHYTGRLQTRKLKEIARHFQVIHSLDHLEHVIRLNAYSTLSKTSKLQVFIQVNLDCEAQKGGVLPENLESFLDALKDLHRLEILGLMLIPKPGTPEELAQKFKKIKSILKQLDMKTQGQLSMGMSADYPLAIEAGATHIRIGTAIFGKR